MGGVELKEEGGGVKFCKMNNGQSFVLIRFPLLFYWKHVPYPPLNPMKFRMHSQKLNTNTS